MAHPPAPVINCQVRCYAGYTYPERPLAFAWQGQEHEVVQVLQRWRDPRGTHFRVLTGSGEQFELIYDTGQDLWSVKRYRTAR